VQRGLITPVRLIGTPILPTTRIRKATNPPTVKALRLLLLNLGQLPGKFLLLLDPPPRGFPAHLTGQGGRLHRPQLLGVVYLYISQFATVEDLDALRDFVVGVEAFEEFVVGAQVADLLEQLGAGALSVVADLRDGLREEEVEDWVVAVE
jgi:hypothetical protein